MIANKADFGARIVIRNKEGHYIIPKALIFPENNTVGAPDSRTLRYMRYRTDRIMKRKTLEIELEISENVC